METTDSRQLKKTQPANVPSWTGYISCEILPLSVFVDCLIDGKYDRLTIEGTTTDEHLKALWLKLYSEYCRISDNEAMLSLVMQIGQMEALQSKLTLCKKLVQQLYNGPNEAFILCLKDWGYKMKYSTDEGYKKELDRIVAMLKGEEERLSKLVDSLAKESKQTATRSDFIQQLAGISKFMGMPVRLNDDKLMVAEYCGYLKMMKQHFEALNKPTVHG